MGKRGDKVKRAMLEDAYFTSGSGTPSIVAGRGIPSSFATVGARSTIWASRSSFCPLGEVKSLLDFLGEKDLQERLVRHVPLVRQEFNTLEQGLWESDGDSLTGRLQVWKNRQLMSLAETIRIRD